MQQTMKLSIEGMHCGACVKRVTNALSAVPGVQVESVDVGSAKVGYDAASVKPDQVTAAVDRIGFKAHVEA